MPPKTKARDQQLLEWAESGALSQREQAEFAHAVVKARQRDAVLPWLAFACGGLAGLILGVIIH